MHPPTRRLAGLLLAAALLPTAAPAAAPAGASPEQPVARGAVVSVDLSRLPSRLQRRGSASCAGTRLTATGEVEVVTCQRPFTFETALGLDPLVVLFRPKGGGAPTRHEFPYAWDPRPRTFTVPADGTVAPEAAPPPKPGAAPRPMSAEALAQARTAATAACADCKGAPAFTLKDLTVEEARAATQDVVITIRPPGQAP